MLSIDSRKIQAAKLYFESILDYAKEQFRPSNHGLGKRAQNKGNALRPKMSNSIVEPCEL